MNKTTSKPCWQWEISPSYYIDIAVQRLPPVQCCIHIEVVDDHRWVKKEINILSKIHRTFCTGIGSNSRATSKWVYINDHFPTVYDCCGKSTTLSIRTDVVLTSQNEWSWNHWSEKIVNLAKIINRPLYVTTFLILLLYFQHPLNYFKQLP